MSVETCIPYGCGLVVALGFLLGLAVALFIFGCLFRGFLDGMFKSTGRE